MYAAAEQDAESLFHCAPFTDLEKGKCKENLFPHRAEYCALSWLKQLYATRCIEPLNAVILDLSLLHPSCHSSWWAVCLETAERALRWGGMQRQKQRSWRKQVGSLNRGNVMITVYFEHLQWTYGLATDYPMRECQCRCRPHMWMSQVRFWHCSVWFVNQQSSHSWPLPTIFHHKNMLKIC